MGDTDRQPHNSIWTRPIEPPPALRPVGRVLLWVFIVIVVLLGSLNTLSQALVLVDAWRWRTGVRLSLSDPVHVHVPERFWGFESDHDEPGVLREYCLSPKDEEAPGGLISVSAIRPHAPLSYMDPAHMAANARKWGKEVEGPATFTYSGFDVTATVEPRPYKGQLEGAHRLSALVDVDGQLVHISCDSAVLGVPDDATPEVMASAAIDLLQLDSD